MHTTPSSSPLNAFITTQRLHHHSTPLSPPNAFIITTPSSSPLNASIITRRLHHHPTHSSSLIAATQELECISVQAPLEASQVLVFSILSCTMCLMLEVCGVGGL
jgi:hypothetical protein